jgi:hypothetical protein
MVSLNGGLNFYGIMNVGITIFIVALNFWAQFDLHSQAYAFMIADSYSY